ncbi:uncharacterized protein RSE6_13796 [Rhynchosporium secalis]|uniref:Heterokaryon incompatibility domain-containing protein n=1 Tax=Rhynchosporium secalis TaxID=38038 RepID=A0A1E1MTS6_RHYSE|nr:uncharacterized protein RSE6_13796 [Rhynchosporium secalis]
MLAKNAQFMCGDRSVSGVAFRNFRNSMLDTRLMWVYRGLRSVGELEEPHKELLEHRFIKYLHAARKKQCLYKEDRVYGLLALAPQAISNQINIIYSNDQYHYVEVYQSLAVELVKTMGPQYMLDVAVSVDQTYCTSRACIQGVELDQISEVVDGHAWTQPNLGAGKCGHADQIYQWLDICENLTKRTLRDPQQHPDAFWQTMVVYSPIENLSGFPDHPMRGSAALRPCLIEMREGGDRTAIPVDDQQASQDRPTHVVRLWPGRVFFSTLGGRVGFADRNIATGGLVRLFFGCHKYYVLPPDAGDTHTLRSTAYVLGLMGDAAESLGLFDDEGKLGMESKEFKIC